MRKNIYSWQGAAALATAISELQTNTITSETEDGSSPIHSSPNSKQACSGRSMGMLCHRFISMFVNETTGSPTKYVSLDAAAASIVDVEGRSNLTKTKAKRLYDIANILSSIGLIRKLSVVPPDMKKPVYYWVGEFLIDGEPKPLALSKKRLSNGDESTTKMARVIDLGPPTPPQSTERPPRACTSPLKEQAFFPITPT